MLRNECIGGSSAGHVLHFFLKGMNSVIHATNNYKKIVNLYVLHTQATRLRWLLGTKVFFFLMFYFWYSLQGSENFKFQWRVSKFASFAGVSLSCPRQNHSNANIFVEILWACSSTIIWFSRLCLFLFWNVVIGLLVFSISTCFLGSSFSLFLVADFSPPKSLINCRKSERY